MENSAYLPAAGWLFFGYLMGSCPTGFILVKIIMDKDIRHFGSGNIGATNVGRVMGKKWAVVTAIIDMLKGGIAILIAMASGANDPWILAAMGVTSVLGHDYPVWLKFNGGKGVSTTFGVFACYDFFNPLPAVIGGVLWLVIREATRIVSLSSMLAIFAASLLMPVFMTDKAYYLSGLFLTALTIFRHRANIKRMIAGNENKVDRLLLK
jgi:glycerol-3-phosphate acyltransferase PlsY